MKQDSRMALQDYSEDDLSDSEIQWRSTKNGQGVILGRRQNSSRPVDLESGLETV